MKNLITSLDIWVNHTLLWLEIAGQLAFNVVQPPLNIIVILVIHHNPAARTISDAISEQYAESFKRNSLVYNGELNTEHM